MPVVFMVLGSAVCVIVGSLLSEPPSEATIRKYFDKKAGGAAGRFLLGLVAYNRGVSVFVKWPPCRQTKTPSPPEYRGRGSHFGA